MVFVVTLLKIWGTLLLIRVILIFILLVLLLLVPFHYHLCGQAVTAKDDMEEIEEETDRIKKGKYQACFQVSWLFRFLNVEAKVYKEENLGFSYFVRAMGEELMSFAEKDILNSDAQDLEEVDSGPSVSDSLDSEEVDSGPSVSDSLDSEEVISNPLDSEASASDPVNSNEPEQSDIDVEDVDGKEEDRMASEEVAKNDSSNKMKKKKKTSKGLGDVLYELAVLRDKYEYFDEVIHEKESLQAVESLKRRIVKLLLSILPRKMQGEVIVGTGEPDSTGMIYGVYCSLFFPKFYPSFVMIPEFDHLALDGEVDITGRIHLGTILVALIGFVLDGQIRELYGKLKFLKEKDAAEWEKQVKKMQRSRNGEKRRARKTVKKREGKTQK